MRKIIFFVSFGLFFSLSSGKSDTNLGSRCCGKQKSSLKSITISGFTQGTYYNILYYAEDTLVKKTEIENFLSDFLKIASLWDSASMISRVNNNEDVTLDSSFIFIFQTALTISKLTHGAFDITIGNLVRTWGFGPDGKQEPDKKIIDSLLQFVGSQNIDIKNERIIKKHPQIKIDFNAIAKGYSVDLLSELLKNKHIDNFIVDIGGEVRTSGTKPDGSLWNIGIEKPSPEDSSQQQIHTIISLTQKSVATSGTYRKYYEKDGMRYSHTIDPKTGHPVLHTLLSATVIADNCITADALATAFMVMGEEEAMNFLKKHTQYDAYFIFTDKNGKLQVSYTEGFEKWIIMK